MDQKVPIKDILYLVIFDSVFEPGDVFVFGLPRGLVVGQVAPLHQVVRGAVARRAMVYNPVHYEPLGFYAISKLK